MDKSWMSMDRRSDEYESGVDRFCEFALRHAADPSFIHCPCLQCGHVKPQTIKEVRNHLICFGIDQSYVTWYWDGEPVPSTMPERKDGIWETYNESIIMENTVEMVEAAKDEFVSNPEAFQKLLEDAEKPIYPGCMKFTKLSTLVRLYNLKAQSGWPDKTFSALLKFLKELLPQVNELPSTLYEAKKTLGSLGMEYEKIHACPNDCILYRGDYSEEHECPFCHVSRWKVSKNLSESNLKKVPAKVMWYFPPIPRFRRMFRNKDTAKNLIWHATEREEDGKLRHPADSPSWKLVDHMWPDFGDDPRNLRLAISADGINPHGNLSSRYSCWPVLMVTYNLPPWLCMKRKFMMLTMLISGPKQPGNDIDVYLAPLIEDLKTLWDIGVEAYDAYSEETFILRAILLLTINDLPAYGNLCGCSVKGYKACPICSDKTDSEWLEFGKKVSFMGHRKYLPRDHVFRKQKSPFNGKQEFGTENVRISVDVSIKDDAKLPNPNIAADIYTVTQAIGTHVAWPRHLVIMSHEEVYNKPVINPSLCGKVGHKVPRSVLLLLRFARTMDKSSNVSVPMEAGVFGNEHNTYLHSNDIIEFCLMQPISSTCIAVYMRHLWTLLRMNNGDNLYAFVDPGCISSKAGKVEAKSRALSIRLEYAHLDQLILAPYNSGNHWLLAVINPFTALVYYFDPLANDVINLGMKTLVETAIKMFNAQKGRKNPKTFNWEVVKCPRQTGSVECGYYIMKYMKEIIGTSSSSILNMFEGKHTYTQEEIDVVRVECTYLVEGCIQDEVV